jgi:hypothetical protein
VIPAAVSLKLDSTPNVARWAKRPRACARDALSAREGQSQKQSDFSRCVATKQESSPSRHRWKPVDQNRLEPCRGRPFGLYGELKTVS